MTKDSIEERVWETLKLKKSLFDGVFDSPTAEVSFAALGRKSVLQAVKESFAEEPDRPVIGPIHPTRLAVPAAPPPSSPAPNQPTFEQAAAGLIETGLKFLESLAAVAYSGRDGASLSSLLSRDPRTNQPVLSIPLPESMNRDRLAGALSRLVNALGRSA